MNGLYPQLVKRGTVPATPVIIRDAEDRFGDQPQGKDGSIVSVLQAYLTMVPDVQYNIGWFPFQVVRFIAYNNYIQLSLASSDSSWLSPQRKMPFGSSSQ